MPKGDSGIRRGGGGGKYDSDVRKTLQNGNYQKSETFQSTTRYELDMVKDPNGTYIHPETREKYSRKETYAENPGFKEIRRVPVGSIVVVRNQSWEFRIAGKIPAHDEYYEVVQRTKSSRALEFRGTSDKEGRYYWRNYSEKAQFLNSGSLKGMGETITTVRGIQERFPLAEEITIYKPNMPE